MENTRLIYKNYWRDGTIVGYTTQNTQFPAVSTQDDDTTLTWRSTAIAAAQKVDCDLGAAVTYDFVALLGHNIIPGVTYIRIYGADDDAFTTNVVYDNLTWNEGDIFAFLGTARTKRYVRVYITDTGNPDGYIEVGTVVVGKYVDLGCPFVQGYSWGADNDTESDETPSHNRFITLSRPARDTRRCVWNGLSETGRGYIAAAVRECGNMAQALALCFDYTDAQNNTYWLLMKDPGAPVNISAALWSWECSFVECV
jgi:hypothetical protein